MRTVLSALAARFLIGAFLAAAISACASIPDATAPVTSPPRITYPDEASLDARQRAIYDETVSGMSTNISPQLARMGPRLLLLHDAPLAEAWGAMGAAMRNSGLSARHRELATLVVAREWNAQFEWYAHEPNAVRAGIPADVIEAIRHDRAPRFTDPDDAVVYAYTHQLMRNHDVDDETYAAAWALLGTKGLLYLTVYIGHYTNVAITLNAHRAALPEGAAPPLPRVQR